MPAAKPKVSLLCCVCGGEYYVHPYRAATSRCCGYTCAQRYAGRAAGKNIITKLRGTGTKTRYVKENGRHQHRVVAERKIGRKLMPGEIVHHKDGDGKNNNEDNLSVITQSNHVRIHWPHMMAKRKEKAGY